MFGYERHEIVGLDVGDMSSGEHPYTLAANLELHKDVVLGDTRVLEWHCKTKDGRLFWAEVCSRTTQFGDAPATLALVRDITHRKAAERELARLKDVAEQANQAKSAFLAMMSHEIRTPLNGLIGMNALLLETKLESDQRKLAETVRESADALLTILDDVLDISKMEANKIDLEDVRFDPGSLVRKAVELLASRASQKGLGLTAEVFADEGATFRGDPARLRQILLNLISNALKFTERGRVDVVVHATCLEGERGRLRFEIRDTGIGICDEAKAKLFAPFVQADASITRRFGGTGLGLSICKKLVELMGGRIGVADREGGGAVFWFEIALARAEPIPVTPGDFVEAPLDRASEGAPSRILLAEDNSINVEVARLILEGAGHEVDVARDGMEAIEAVARRGYDLILMDMQMPRLDGLTATREIRSRESEGRRVPIVAMTANAMASDQRRCLDAGMDDYVTKPITPDRLRAAVARWTKEASVPASAAKVVAPDVLPVIDDEVVDSLRSCMDHDEFADLLGLYFAQVDDHFRQLERSRATLPLAEIREEADKVISSAGTLGARRVQDLAGRLQSACEAGDAARAAALMDELAGASREASARLRERLAA